MELLGAEIGIGGSTAGGVAWEAKAGEAQMSAARGIELDEDMMGID